MTTTTAAPTTSTPSRTVLLAVLGLASSALLTAIGTWTDVTNNDDSSADKNQVGEWLVTVGIAAVVAAIVFGLVVRTASAHAGRRAVITGVVGFLSLAVFWAGIPMVLAAAATACGLVQRDRLGAFDGASKVALGLSGLITAGAVALAITG